MRLFKRVHRAVLAVVLPMLGCNKPEAGGTGSLPPATIRTDIVGKWVGAVFTDEIKLFDDEWIFLSDGTMTGRVGEGAELVSRGKWHLIGDTTLRLELEGDDKPVREYRVALSGGLLKIVMDPKSHTESRLRKVDESH